MKNAAWSGTLCLLLAILGAPARAQQAPQLDSLKKDKHYESFLAPGDKPAVEMNKEKMEKFAPELRKYYYDPARFKTYLEQLGIQYPTLKQTP
jgi:hypothetical protein